MGQSKCKSWFFSEGPSGGAIFTMMDESETNERKIHFESLGECLPGESYSISVFSMNDISAPIDFKIKYDWGQSISKAEANSLSSATEGSSCECIECSIAVYFSIGFI